MKIKSAILLTNRPEVRDAVRQELKMLGFASADIHNVRSLVEYKNAQKEVDSAFQILDWEVNPEDVLQILRENCREYRTDSDPVFLIAAQLNPNLMAVAHEFAVSHVHAGEITRDLIRNQMKNMIRETTNLEPIKQVFAKIEKFYHAGNLDGAAQLLEQLYDKAPNNARVIADLAENYMQKDRWDEAYNILIKVKDLRPGNARILHLLAKYYLKKSDVKQALSALEGAQVVNPYNVERLLELGNLLLADKPEEAKTKFNAALEIAPKSKKGKMGKGSAMLLLGEVNETLSMVKDAVNSRELASIFNTSAILSIKAGKHETGIELYKTALAALGRNSKVQAKLMYNMGIGYVKWSKKDRGLDCFSKAVDLDPQFKDAAFNLKAVGGSQKPSIDSGSSAVDLEGLEESLTTGGDSPQLAFSTDFEDDFA